MSEKRERWKGYEYDFQMENWDEGHDPIGGDVKCEFLQRRRNNGALAAPNRWVIQFFVRGSTTTNFEFAGIGPVVHTVRSCRDDLVPRPECFELVERLIQARYVGPVNWFRGELKR